MVEALQGLVTLIEMMKHSHYHRSEMKITKSQKTLLVAVSLQCFNHQFDILWLVINGVHQLFQSLVVNDEDFVFERFTKIFFEGNYFLIQMRAQVYLSLAAVAFYV